MIEECQEREREMEKRKVSVSGDKTSIYNKKKGWTKAHIQTECNQFS